MKSTFLQRYWRQALSVGWILVGILLMPDRLTGQDIYGAPEQVFAFVRNDKGRSALVNARNYKYENAKAVFEKLVRARGDFRQPVPAFEMNDGELYIAWMNPRKLSIGLEEKAYDLCMSMGADSLTALAALLAHELVHYYEKHDWNRHFAQHNQDLETAHKLGHMAEGLKQEAQADYLGGFLAHTAGYDVNDIMPALLEKLYIGYGLPAELQGYPSLSERIAMSRNALTRLRELLLVFETAGMLTLTRQYRDAVDYYRYLVVDFPSRELVNNAGVNLLLAALQYFAPSEMPFVLPLEWDTQTRLRSSKSVDPRRILLRNELILDAIEQFDRAIKLDPDYSPAYLNKACAYILLHESEDAVYWLRKGSQSTHLYNEDHYHIAEGVRHALEGDHATARMSFQKTASSAIAGLNMAILEGQPLNVDPAVTRQGVDLIDGTNLNRYLQNPVTDLEVDLGHGIFAAERSLKNSRILLHYADNGARYGVYHLCDGDCSEQTISGITRGMNFEAVVKTYGQPAGVLALTTGYLVDYPVQRLFFAFSTENTVLYWGTYRSSNEAQ